MRIFLIGFMGCGKSTIGKMLAEKLNYAFTDLDLEIEAAENRSITDIFKEEGEEAFRDLEAHFIADISKKENVVVACGGGTPCFGNNMSIMNDSGHTIYLELREDELLKRLRDGREKRPLIENLTEDGLKPYIETTLSKRMPFYLQARTVLDTNEKSVQEIIEEIQRLFP